VRTDELYPYWPEVHQDLIERLDYLTDEHLDLKPHDGAESIKQIVLRFVETERFYAHHLAGGNDWERPSPSMYEDGAALVDLLNATREITERVMEPLTTAGLRSVRTVPGDPAENRPDTNMPVGWLLWHVMEREIECLGQVSLRLRDAKSKKPGRWG
jgi:uncharacterized damage-inducible protein DinB